MCSYTAWVFFAVIHRDHHPPQRFIHRLAKPWTQRYELASAIYLWGQLAAHISFEKTFSPKLYISTFLSILLKSPHFHFVSFSLFYVCFLFPYSHPFCLPSRLFTCYSLIRGQVSSWAILYTFVLSLALCLPGPASPPQNRSCYRAVSHFLSLTSTTLLFSQPLPPAFITIRLAAFPRNSFADHSELYKNRVNVPPVIDVGRVTKVEGDPEFPPSSQYLQDTKDGYCRGGQRRCFWERGHS